MREAHALQQIFGIGRPCAAALVFSQQQALSTRAVNRILEQGTWEPVPGASGTLQTQGFDPWFAEQVAAPVSTYPDQPLFNSAGC
jgi:hypothetical protein